MKVQVKKLETDLVNLGSKPNEKKSNKKLIDEKDKLIENIQKKLKGYVTDHLDWGDYGDPDKEWRTQEGKYQVKGQVVVGTKEKEELSRRDLVEVSSSTAQQVDTKKLTRSLAQVSLKKKKRFLNSFKRKIN